MSGIILPSRSESQPAPTLAQVQLVYGRQPDPAWQQALDDLTGHTDFFSRLVIWWEPGDAWEPVQRWVIYNVLPRRIVQTRYPEVWTQLNGPHPRSSGHGCFPGQCLCLRKQYRWRYGPAPLITRTAWEIARKYEGWAKPYWVVQGANGGHRYKWHPWESQLSRLHGGPEQPPAPGDLPYAEPDRRTWDALAQADLMRRYRFVADAAKQGLGVVTDAEQRAAAEEAARVLYEYYGTAAAQFADELTWAMKRDTTIGRPQHGTEMKELDGDQVRAEFVRESSHDLLGAIPGTKL